jgi:hypothetical protein
MATGVWPVIVHIVAHGGHGYLDAESVTRRTRASLLDTYRRYCGERGVDPQELTPAQDGSSRTK